MLATPRVNSSLVLFMMFYLSFRAERSEVEESHVVSFVNEIPPRALSGLVGMTGSWSIA